MDLVGLYEHKNWFREPAVHALKEIFTFVAVSCGLDILGRLVQNTMSKFLTFERKSRNIWSAEKIALYLHLQTMYVIPVENGDEELPQCLETALLTKSNLDCDIGGGIMKIMLRDTSAAVYPRSHLVWASVWSYISQPFDSSTNRVLREQLIVGDDTAEDIVDALVNKVIVESLLGDEGVDQNSAKATPGRRALSLSLVHQLCALSLPSYILEEVVLQKSIVSNLFIHTLQKFSGGAKTHTLKPLALDILKNIVDSLCSKGYTEENVLRRIGAAKAFLRANQSFDAVTKTDAVSLLLGLEGDEENVDDESSNESGRKLLWELHFQFVMDEILDRLSSDEPAIQEANKYMDIMYAFVKKILRIGNIDEKKSLFRRTLSFFMTGAFFDLQKFDSGSVKTDSVSHVLNAACRIKKSIECAPFASRVVMSSRFFSLLSDYIHTVTFQQLDDDVKENTKDKKVSIVQEEVSRINQGIQILQDHKASLFSSNSKEDADDSMIDDDSVVSASLGGREASDAINGLKVQEGEHAATTKRAISAIACLVSSLSLQLLHPGLPKSNEGMEGGEEEDDYSEEISETISDLSDIATAFAKTQAADEDSEDNDEALSSLASISVNILRSPIGGSGLQTTNVRGGASKIVRDCLQIAWSASLASSSTDSGDHTLNAEVIDILLEAVCTPKALAQGESEADDESIEEFDESGQDSDDSDENVAPSFSNINDTENASDNEDENMTDETEEKGTEIELDSSKLENLLIQSSDDDDSVDANMLEHHEGADAALAQLLQLKQDARKSGREQKEKIELADRIRCIGLLEAVFQTNKRTTLLSNQVTLMVILPLLRTMSELLKSISSVVIHKKGSSSNDKKVLVGKISTLLMNKVCKSHVNGCANVDTCKTVAGQVLMELRRVKDANHAKCCGALLVLLVKAVINRGDEAISMARTIYGDAIKEWSTKKSTKIQSVIFDDLGKRHHR